MVDGVIATFVASAALLLAIPGPTNTLFAASGAAVGLRKSLALIVVAIAAYVLAILILMQIYDRVFAGSSVAGAIAKAIASLILVTLAVRLWRPVEAGLDAVPMRPISPAQMFVATLFNPKALIFAFAVFPRVSPSETAGLMGLFAILAAAAGGAWVVLGRMIALSAGRAATAGRIRRAAALILCVFATVIASSAIAAVLS